MRVRGASQPAEGSSQQQNGRSIRQEHIGKDRSIFVETVSLECHVLPKGEVRRRALGPLAGGLAFLRAVDAAEAKAFRVLVVARTPWP
ncbi:hypothetical protein AYO43_08505 [Nitrospira sp. SCGC AG-212-E16]|nr:hypothetical protein AYO43_08505 [Nitrospira sp. SCGC AG-212-E16]